MPRRIAVRGIFVLDDKLLCAKLKPYKEADAGDYWSVLGGTVDPGEALIPAVEREIVEETGVQPKVGKLLYIQQYLHGGQEHMELFFHILNASDYQNIDLSKTTHGATEIAELAFIDPTKHTILPKFLTTESFDNLADQPTKIFNYLGYRGV